MDKCQVVPEGYTLGDLLARSLRMEGVCEECKDFESWPGQMDCLTWPISSGLCPEEVDVEGGWEGVYPFQCWTTSPLGRGECEPFEAPLPPASPRNRVRPRD